MLNWKPESPDMYADVQSIYHYEHDNLKKSPEERLRKLWRCSRESSRTLVQWDDTANAGFTTGKPWFYANENYKQINVAQQEKDPDSILNFYRKAIALRKSLPVVRHGNYTEHFRSSRKQYVYTREMPGEKLLVICSFSEQAQPLKIPAGFDVGAAKQILGNYPAAAGELRPYEVRVYHIKG